MDNTAKTSGTVGSGLSAMGMISREKYWSELTTEEKVERSRLQVQKLQDKIGQLETKLSNLNNKFCNHDHINGKVVIAHNTEQYTAGEQRLNNRNKPDEVFF